MKLQEQLGIGIYDIAKEIITIDTDGDTIFTARLSEKVEEEFKEIPREWLSAVDTSFDSMTETYPLVSFIFEDEAHTEEMIAAHSFIQKSINELKK